MKKSIKYTLAVAGIGAIALTTLGAGSVMAHGGFGFGNTDKSTQVMDKVISKLNLNVTSEQLSGALQTSNQELRHETMSEELKTAVTEGKISQEVADKALKIMDARATAMESVTRPNEDELDNLTRAEMRTRMETQRAEMEKKISELSGLTTAEIEEVQDTLRDADLGGMGMGPGGMGEGKMGHGKMGRGQMGR